MDTFLLFSKEHLFYIFGYGIFLTALFYIPKVFKFNQSQIHRYGKFTGIIVLIIKFIELTYDHFVLKERILDLLPLNLCNYTLILVCLIMIFKSEKLFSFTYFWSAGAIFAILTPDIRTSFPNIVNVSFFITHFYIYFGIFYAMKYFKFKVTFKGLKVSIILINLITIVIFPMNLILKTNFMFLRHKPISSPMDFLGPWPYYIIWLELIMIFLFILMYLPFRKKNK